uniref:Uncharacterized protein n=1 Tax=Anguilla anguilla TaxID=7936 RepID=A0A0E9QIZ2_ANGAN
MKYENKIWTSIGVWRMSLCFSVPININLGCKTKMF